MKKTKLEVINLIKTQKTSVIKATEGIKSLFHNKVRFINHDGTIAENVDSWKQFRNDFNNRNYGF
jgi:hypothetical protein